MGTLYYGDNLDILTRYNDALKPTSFLYLHCDPTASHYLKLLPDAVIRKTTCLP